MKTLIKNELRLSEKVQIIWMAIMLILIGFCYFEFLSLKDSLDDMAKMMDGFPEILRIMFGVRGDLNTALGWYGCLYFWTGILAFAYAMYLGITCVAKEKLRGTSEYLFTKPVRRSRIVLAKVIASAIHLAVFAAFTGVCSYWLLILPMGGLEESHGAIAAAVGLYLTQLVLFSVGVFLAGVVKHYPAAMKAGTAAVLIFYGTSFAAEYTGLAWMNDLTPLRYFDVYEVVSHGFRPGYLALSAAVVLFCTAGAVKSWERREM
ncbi:MAG: ABC transporter permease subunit [Lachnospiraceae bacterium]|nr:ABC transporter permease subunit [Lachnospiraceae bacterium]